MLPSPTPPPQPPFPHLRELTFAPCLKSNPERRSSPPHPAAALATPTTVSQSPASSGAGVWGTPSGATVARSPRRGGGSSGTWRESARPLPGSGVCARKGAAAVPGRPSPAPGSPPARRPGLAARQAQRGGARGEGERRPGLPGSPAGGSQGDRGGGGQGACALQGRQIWREGECPKLFVWWHLCLQSLHFNINLFPPPPSPPPPRPPPPPPPLSPEKLRPGGAERRCAAGEGRRQAAGSGRRQPRAVPAAPSWAPRPPRHGPETPTQVTGSPDGRPRAGARGAPGAWRAGGNAFPDLLRGCQILRGPRASASAAGAASKTNEWKSLCGKYIRTSGSVPWGSFCKLHGDTFLLGGKKQHLPAGGREVPTSPGETTRSLAWCSGRRRGSRSVIGGCTAICLDLEVESIWQI